MRPRQRVQVNLPAGSRARWYRDGTGRQVVNVYPHGDVRYDGNCYRFATGSKKERAESLRRLCDALSPGRPLMLHADRSVHWEDLRDILRVAIEDPLRIRRLEWGVVVPGRLRDVVQAAEVTPLPTQSGPALAIELEGDGTSLESVSARLEGAIGAHAVVALQMPAGESTLRWEHVVWVLDRILEVGFRQVDVPAFGVRLSLLEPDDLTVNPFVYPDDPVVTRLIVFLSVLVLVGIFLLTFAPLRGLRRNRPGRRRASKP